MSTNNRLLLSSKMKHTQKKKTTTKAKQTLKKKKKTIQNFKESLPWYQQAIDCLCGLLG